MEWDAEEDPRFPSERLPFDSIEVIRAAGFRSEPASISFSVALRWLGSLDCRNKINAGERTTGIVMNGCVHASLLRVNRSRERARRNLKLAG